MQTSTDFHQRADQLLQDLQDHLEASWDQVEVDLLGDTLTIELVSGQQFIINKHTPTQQVWLASPFSGAHHFRHSAESDQWCDIRGGQRLNELLDNELKAHAA